MSRLDVLKRGEENLLAPQVPLIPRLDALREVYILFK